MKTHKLTYKIVGFVVLSIVTLLGSCTTHNHYTQKDSFGYTKSPRLVQKTVQTTVTTTTTTDAVAENIDTTTIVTTENIVNESPIFDDGLFESTVQENVLSEQTTVINNYYVVDNPYYDWNIHWNIGYRNHYWHVYNPYYDN